MPGSKKGSAKKKTPKQQIAELTEQNEKLTQELESLRTAHQQMTSKVTDVTNKIIEGIDKKEFNIRDDVNVVDLSTETLIKMVEKIIVIRKHYNGSVECRVEELETRLTQMSMDLAKATKKTLAYEQGMEDLHTCFTLSQVRDKVYQLQFIAGLSTNFCKLHPC